MAGFLESLAAKLGGSALTAVFQALRARFSPRRLARPAAPRNFFEHFGPGVPRERVAEILGAPHRQVADCWGYCFKDALAQFVFSESGTATLVALALTVNSPKSGFPIPMLGESLGKLKLDYFFSDTDGEFSFEDSLRTWELRYTTRLPPSVNHVYYIFGALSALTPGELKESSFNVALARTSPRFASKGTDVNWVGVTSSPELAWFEWSLALPVAA